MAYSKAAIKAIIPENFKNIKLIKDTMDVFVDFIWKHSKVSVDIKALFDSGNPVLYEEIIKTYAADFYKCITDNNNNHKLLDILKEYHKHVKYEKWQDLVIDINVIDYLNSEMLQTWKIFGQTKGTFNSIEYIYHLINKFSLEQGVLETSDAFKIYEGKNILEYVVEGEMLPEIFESYVKVLSHPVGWAYIYFRIYELRWKDYFLSKEIFDITTFRIVCDSGVTDDFKANTGFLFQTGLKNETLYNNKKSLKIVCDSKIKKDVTRFGKFYSIFEDFEDLKLVINNTIKSIDKVESKGVKTLTIEFESGERLVQISKPRSLILYYPIGTSKPFKEKKIYPVESKHCAIELAYTSKIVTSVKDLVSFQFDFGLAETAGNKIVVGAGNVFVGSKNWKLGMDRLPTADVSYGTRVVNGSLKPSDFKALYRLSRNKIRPIFDRILKDFVYFYVPNIEKSDTFPFFLSIDSNTFEISETQFKSGKFKIPKLDAADHTIELRDSNNLLMESITFRPDIYFDNKSTRDSYWYQINFRNSKRLESYFNSDLIAKQVLKDFKSADFASNEVTKMSFDPWFRNSGYVKYSKDLESEKIFAHYYHPVVSHFNVNGRNLDFSDSVEYAGNSGLFVYDTFEINGELHKNFGNLITFSLSDGIPKIYDSFGFVQQGFYQSIYGWKSGYVDIYDTVDKFENFVDTTKIDELYQFKILDDLNVDTVDFESREFPISINDLNTDIEDADTLNTDYAKLFYADSGIDDPIASEIFKMPKLYETAVFEPQFFKLSKSSNYEIVRILDSDGFRINPDLNKIPAGSTIEIDAEYTLYYSVNGSKIYHTDLKKLPDSYELKDTKYIFNSNPIFLRLNDLLKVAITELDFLSVARFDINPELDLNLQVPELGESKSSKLPTKYKIRFKFEIYNNISFD